MERQVNLADVELSVNAEAPEGFQSAAARLGNLVGARDSGTSIYELAPGQAVAPYHYEYGEEEWLLVLEGTPWLRTPEGRRELKPLDLVFFPFGPDGAHQVGNATESAVRLLMWSTIRFPTVCAYPDTEKVAIWDEQRKLQLTVARASGIDYFAGEESPGG